MPSHTTGSEINFFRGAPTESNRRERVWGHNDDFPLTNKIEYKYADYWLNFRIPGHWYTYRWKPKTNKSNAGHKRSFVWTTNVSTQLFTFSCLYLLEKKGTRLKNCCLILCCMFKTVFPFVFCQDDWRIMMLLVPGHNRAAFFIPVLWTACNTYVMGNMAVKLRTDHSCDTLW